MFSKSTGNGKLTLTNYNSTFTGDIVISGGTLSIKDNSSSHSSKEHTAVGDLTQSRKIIVKEGATLELASQEVFSNSSSDVNIALDVDGGTISNTDATVVNKLYNLTLRNGATIHVKNGSSWKGIIFFATEDGDGKKVNIRKSETRDSTEPVRFTSSGAANADFVSRNSVFYVEDITNNANDGSVDNLSDLIVSARFTEYDSYHFSITKEGPGTMELSGVNTYTGATTISAGTLTLSGSGNLTGTSSVSVASGATLEFKDSNNITFNKQISGAGALVKSGTGTVTLTQALTNLSGNTTISGGGLTLSNSSVASTLNNLIGGSLIADGADSDVFVNLTSNANLTLNNADMTKFIGSITASGLKIEKTGNGTLQIYTGATGKVDAQSMTISSGELDLKGYMSGGISVEGPNAVFSPGNSVGDAVFGGGYILKEGATLLIEQDETGIDTLTASSFGLVGNDNHIEFDFTAFAPGKEYDYIILTDGFGEGQNEPNYWTALYTGNLPDYFTTSVFINDDGYGVVRLTAPSANAVPEPSTCALLALGVAGLMYLRKRVRN